MPRIINFRTFLYTAISAIIGSFVGVLFCFNIASAIVLFSVFTVANIVLFIIYFKKAKYAAAFLIGALVLIAMAIISALTVSDRHLDLDYSVEHEIQGSVYSVSTEAGECSIVADNIIIDGQRSKGKMRIYAEVDSEDKLEFLREGDDIKTVSVIYKFELISDNFINAYSAGSNIRYVIYVSSADITYEANQNIIEKLRSSLRFTLVNFMGERYGNLAFGMIAGEKSNIDTSSSTYFGIAGIGHIFAVSGLHIGFVVALLSFLLKRVNAKIKVPIIAVFLFAYALFAGFSPSVLRAMIMSSVCLLTLVNGQRSDLLNNLSLAFTAIIAVSPFALFDAGFLMSFTSAFGIACFSNPITRILAKCKLPRAVVSAVAVSTSAQIGILPCLIYYFHSLPLYSIVVNIILMPVITLCFILLLLVCAVFLPFSFAAPLAVPQSLLVLIDGAARFATSLPLAQISLYASGAVFALLPLYFLISPYIMLPRFKWIVSLCAAIGCSVVCGVSLQTFDIDSAVIPVYGYNDTTSLIYRDGKVLLVGDCRNGKQISRALHSNRLGKIDAVYLTSLNADTAKAVTYLRDNGECTAVYCPYGKEGEGLTMLLESDVEIYVFDETDLPTEINAEYSDNVFVGYSIDLTHGKKLLLLGAQSRYDKLDTQLINSVAVIRCRLFNGAFDDRIFLTNFSVDTIDIAGKYVYPLTDTGSYIFDYEHGKFYSTRGG